MKKIYISIFLISQLISCNRHRETEIPFVGRFNPEIIYVDKFQEPLPWHEFADTLFVVPLETNDDCIISKITRITYRQDKFFIHDQSQQALYVFDQNGNYLNKLDKQGRGPGEYLDLRDFKIDSKGNIYILTYNKIQIYSPDLEFIDDINFNVIDSNGDLFGAINFAFAGNNGFYLWRGSFGIHEKPGNLSYSMVKIDLEGKILARYFPVEKKLYMGTRFFEADNGYNFRYFTGNDTIYWLDEHGLSPRFIVDFGNRALPPGYIPNKFDHEVGQAIRQPETRNYAIDVDNVYETGSFLYFSFIHKGSFYFTIYSKKSKKHFTQKNKFQYPISPQIVCCANNNYFVSELPAFVCYNRLQEIKEADNINFRPEHVAMLNKLTKLNYTDNPVLFIFSLKEF